MPMTLVTGATHPRLFAVLKPRVYIEEVDERYRKLIVGLRVNCPQIDLFDQLIRAEQGLAGLDDKDLCYFAHDRLEDINEEVSFLTLEMACLWYARAEDGEYVTPVFME